MQRLKRPLRKPDRVVLLASPAPYLLSPQEESQNPDLRLTTYHAVVAAAVVIEIDLVAFLVLRDLPARGDGQILASNWG